MDRLLELTSQAEASHFWFRGFRQFVAPLLERAAAGRTNLTLLDCGCGTGYNLRLLEPYGNPFGMDLTAAGLAIARRAHHALVRGDATSIPFASSSVDLATSFDMLQCVADDRSAVAEIARILKPGGRLIGTAAALDVLHGDHSVLSEEVRRYTRDRMRRLLRSAGLQPVEVRYAFASLFPLVLGVRALQRLRGAHADGREITVPPAPLNALLTAVVSAEAAATRRGLWMPFGSSVVFFARKP